MSALFSFSAEYPSLICRCKVLANHTKFLGSLLETGTLRTHVTRRDDAHSLLAPPFGLPVDTRYGQTTSIGELSMTSMAYTTQPEIALGTAWLLFTAAAMADQGVRDGLIHLAWAKASFNGTQGIFSDFYNGVSGRGEDFAR